VSVTDFLRQCPLLLESDILSLSSKFWVSQNKLIDRELALKHKVSPKAGLVLQRLMDMVLFADLQQFSQQAQLKPNELQAILGFLNSIGALRVSRNSQLHTVQVLLWHALHGVFYAPICRRKPATPLAVAEGCLRASLSFTVASFACATLLCLSGAFAWFSIGSFCAIFTATFLLSLTLHELAHGYFARAPQESQPVVLQVGTRLSLLHQPLHWPQEIASSITGPLVGVITCLGAALLWQQFISIFWQSCLLGILSITHAGALFPQYSDGKSLATALKERKCLK